MDPTLGARRLQLRLSDQAAFPLRLYLHEVGVRIATGWPLMSLLAASLAMAARQTRFWTRVVGDQGGYGSQISTAMTRVEKLGERVEEMTTNNPTMIPDLVWGDVVIEAICEELTSG